MPPCAFGEKSQTPVPQRAEFLTGYKVGRPLSGLASMSGTRTLGLMGGFGAARAVLTGWQRSSGTSVGTRTFLGQKTGDNQKGGQELRPMARPSRVRSPEGAAAGRKASGTSPWGGGWPARRKGRGLICVRGSSGGRGRGLGDPGRPCTHNAGKVGVFRVRHGGGEAELGDQSLGGAGAGNPVRERLGPGPRKAAAKGAADQEISR